MVFKHNTTVPHHSIHLRFDQTHN